jgi:beta-mannosidase
VVVDGDVSHLRKRRLGLRRIELDDWVMSVNGARLFLKGAMLHPSNRALGSISADRIDADLALAVDANIDLLRVATHVARPELYRRADEIGMLLWQDLPMTRGMHRSARSSAARQAVDLVDKLGHHPSIVMWCGHDDPTGRSAGADVLADPKGFRRWKRRQLAAQELPSWNRSVLDRSVANAFRGADPSRPTIPHSGVLPHPPFSEGTDAELWLGWERGDERDLVSWGRRIPGLLRFVSGIGAQSVPDTSDLFGPEAWPDLDWERLSRHHGLRKVQLDRRVPVADHDSFTDWKNATQRSHADVVRRHVEQLRIRKYRPTGGFVVETLIDPQHAISTALVDHARVPKAAYDALVNACQPVIVAADVMPADVQPGEDLELDVYVVNDRRTPLVAEVTAVIEGPGGPMRWRWAGDVDADDVAKVGRIEHRVGSGAGELSLTLTVTGAGVSHTTRETATVTAL